VLPGTRKAKKESSRKRNVQEGIFKRVANGLCWMSGYEIRDTRYGGMGGLIRRSRAEAELRPREIDWGDGLSLIIEGDGDQ
jgi:hypothetical protein